MPEGFVSAGPLPDFTLRPGQSGLALVHIYVPENARAGVHKFAYRARRRLDGSVLATHLLSVDVLPSLALEIKIVSFPDVVIAGMDYPAEYIIYNLGNTRTVVDLEVKCGERYAWDFREPPPPGGIVLEMGEQKKIEIIVHTDRAARRAFMHRLEVRVLQAWQAPVDGAPRKKGTLLTRAIGNVEVVPLSTLEGSLMHTLPFELGIKGFTGFTNDSWLGGGELTLDGKGTLDEKGEHAFEMHVKKRMDSTENILLNSWDRYSISYRSLLLQVMAGDNGYSLSPLLDKFRYGRGVGVSVFPMPFSLGVYYCYDLWGAGFGQSLGGFAAYQVTETGLPREYRYRVSLDFLTRLQNNFLFGIHQTYLPLPEIILDLDAAGEIDGDGAFTKALYFNGMGDHGWVYYSLNGIYADPGFEGDYRDLYKISANGGLRLLDRRLTFQAAFYILETNLLLNPALATAHRTRFIQAGAGYVIPLVETNLSLTYQNIQRTDRFPAYAYDTGQHNIKLTARQPLGLITVAAGAMAGFSYDYATSVFAFSHNYNAGMTWRPSSNMEYGFWLWYDGTINPSVYNADRFGLSVTGQFTIDKFILSAGIKNGYLVTGDNLEWVNLDLSANASYLFPNRHKLTAGLSSIFVFRTGEADAAFSLWAKYSIPFDFPVSRKEGVCRVKGRVFDAVTGLGLPEVILRINGLAASTDKDGNYSFFLPKGGAYFLSVERGALGIDRIPDIKTPVKLDIAPGDEKTIDLGVVRAATVRGHVAVYLPEHGAGTEGGVSGALQRSAGLSNMLVEIACADETRRMLTDRNGEFLFEEVRPGGWKFKVLSGGIPAYHRFETDELDFALVPGEHKDIVIRVLKEKREIKMIEETKTLELTPEVDDTTPEKNGKTVPKKNESKEKQKKPKPTVKPKHTVKPSPRPSPRPPVTPEPSPLPTETPRPIPKPTPTPAPLPDPSPTPNPYLPTPAPSPNPYGSRRGPVPGTDVVGGIEKMTRIFTLTIYGTARRPS